MDTTEVDYDLPRRAIAQVPMEPRDAARLLLDRGPGRPPDHGHIPDLVGEVRPGDVVVVNTTRVIPARLRLTRPTGGSAEVLLLEPLDPEERRWEALVRPGRKVGPGTVLRTGDLEVEVGDERGGGRREVEVHLPPGATLLGALASHGEMPLPPYISTPLADPERYQTTYAQQPGSVAAPTAGLHLTDAVLSGIRATGASVHTVVLAVGLGTFRPISAERIEDHQMHPERYRVPAETMDACASAQRVLAVGTTTVRALESAHRTGKLEGRTDLYLHGEGAFGVAHLLLTNFHQPRSSLLVLVDAFVGPRWRSLYDEALAEGYRFLSFGDAMLLRGERG